jgi:agarase
MSVQEPRTRWGGLADGRFPPSGFFRVAHGDGVFWLADPEGGRYLSKGVNTVRFDQDQIRNSGRVPYAEACEAKYGSEGAWRTAAAARLTGWGFNTLGSWSNEAVADAGPAPLAVTPNLDLGMSFAWQNNDRDPSAPRQHFPDVFDPAFETHVRARARQLCMPHRGQANVIGWFIDNELRWGPDWRGPEELLPLFLALAPPTPGRVAAQAFLRARRGSSEAFDDGDCEAFVALLAQRYFALTVAAIKAADPDHLVLGSRFALPPGRAVIDAAAAHVDVISFNCYDPLPDAALVHYTATGKPCLIGEFSFRAEDSGLPNTGGAGPKVATQAERANAFRNYVIAALRERAIVGYHWFEHADQPAEGRFDGENSNFGTVTIDDHVYDELTRAMTALNAEAESIHIRSEEGAA